jgi:hypothetical protein
MKKIFFAFTIISGIIFSGCIKNEPVIYEQTTIEFDAATWNTNSPGVTYPIMTRVPTYGATGGGVNITRLLDTVRLRVNLVGAQRATASSFSYSIDAASTAVAGTHFTTLSGTGTIPANSSFGIISVPLLNPGSTAAPRILVLQLNDNPDIKANVNYAKIGLSIAQL